MGVSIVIRSGVILFISIYLYYRWVPSVYETNGVAKALCITLYSVSFRNNRARFDEFALLAKELLWIF